MNFLIISILSAILLCHGDMRAQSKKKQDVKAINAMCGCYEVSFNFAETFSPLEDYAYKENYYAKGLEYVFAITDQETKNNDKIVLQHLLITPKQSIVKHWRQDWVYENTDLYTYQKDNVWKFVSLAPRKVKGKWTQKVYQVDDGPRYEGIASWVHNDGKHYWESLVDAPLPRRELRTRKRKDYNLMRRRNRHEIVDFGWVHEQDNEKIMRGEVDNQLIVKEKGWNTYTKVDESKCEVAKVWWQQHKQYWADVRKIWQSLFDRKQDITIKAMPDGEPMYRKLLSLDKEINTNLDETGYNTILARKRIRKIIATYIDMNNELVSNIKY